MTSEQRSHVMRQVRSKNTAFERKIFNELRRRGLKFKTHYKFIIGNPDIAIPNKKRAVFLHSDFWHGWQLPRWKNKLTPYWKDKLFKNRLRDRRVAATLRKNGWHVLVIWEHQIVNNHDEAMQRIGRALI